MYMLQNFSENGVFETFWQGGALTYTAVVFVANIRVALMQDQWHSLNVLILLLSVAVWFLVGFAVSSLLAVDFNWFQLFNRLLGENTFWSALFFVVILIFMKDIAIIHIKNTWYPSNVQIMTEIQFYGNPNADPAVSASARVVHTEAIELDKPGSSLRLHFEASKDL